MVAIISAYGLLCLVVLLVALRGTFRLRLRLHALAAELECPRQLILPSLARREQEIAKRIRELL